MSVIGALPTTIKNGDAEDANVVMALFQFIQSQVNANAAVAGPLAMSGITGAAASGANNDITSLGAMTTPLAGHRNRLRNGNFSINQRGVSGTVTLSAGQYGHDGWKAGASGCTYTFATSGTDTVITITAGSLLHP